MTSIGEVVIIRLMIFFSVIGMVGCSSNSKKVDRDPSSVSEYADNENQSLLSLAADQKILLLITDQDVKDNSYSQVESCKDQGIIEWPSQFYNVLKLIKDDPSLNNKIHFVQIVKSDKSYSAVIKQQNGVSILLISYLKTETRSAVEAMSQISCPKLGPDLIGKTLNRVQLVWPTTIEIQSALKSATPRSEIKEWDFSNRWMKFLAQNMTVIRASDEMVADPSYVQYFMNEYSQDLASVKSTEDLQFWLKQINTRSNLAMFIQTMKINKTFNANYGIKVDSLGKMARKISGSSDPTYFFMNIKFDNVSVTRPTLNDLNACLKDLSERFKDRRSFNQDFEDDREAYLYPGLNCADPK